MDDSQASEDWVTPSMIDSQAGEDMSLSLVDKASVEWMATIGFNGFCTYGHTHSETIFENINAEYIWYITQCKCDVYDYDNGMTWHFHLWINGWNYLFLFPSNMSPE